MKRSDIVAHSLGYIWQGTAEAAIRDIAAAGFDRVELIASPGHLDIWAPLQDTISSLHRACLHTGSSIAAIDLAAHDYNLGSLAESVRLNSVEACQRLLCLAEALEATRVVVHAGRRIGFVPPPDRRETEALRRSFDALSVTAERYGVRLVVENIVPAIAASARSIAKLVNSGGWPNVGVAYDLANGLVIGDRPEDALNLLADHVEMIHVSDTTAEKHAHDEIGRGAIDFAAVWKSLQNCSNLQDVVIEIISPTPGASMRKALPALERCGWVFDPGMRCRGT